MNLPYDVSRCGNEDCQKRLKCRRFVDPGHPTYQVFSVFPGGDDCYAFIGNDQP